MKRTVVYAKLHDGVDYLPGVGVIGNTLPASNKTLDKLSMFTDGNILYVYFVYQGREKNAGIPLANVKIMDFAKEEESELKLVSA